MRKHARMLGHEAAPAADSFAIVPEASGFWTGKTDIYENLHQ
jgi:hypothetical protein